MFGGAACNASPDAQASARRHLVGRTGGAKTGAVLCLFGNRRPPVLVAAADVREHIASADAVRQVDEVRPTGGKLTNVAVLQHKLSAVVARPIRIACDRPTRVAGMIGRGVGVDRPGVASLASSYRSFGRPSADGIWRRGRMVPIVCELGGSTSRSVASDHRSATANGSMHLIMFPACISAVAVARTPCSTDPTMCPMNVGIGFQPRGWSPALSTSGMFR